MDDCRRTEERLTPYVDDALPPAERGQIERHLGDCPPCRTSAVEQEAGRSIVRQCADKLRQPPLPPGLRSRCEALAREHARVKTVASWRTRLVPLTLMATVVVLAGIALLSVATRRSDAVLAAQLTADHVKCFRVFVPGAAAADPQDVERLLEEQYGWDMHVPPSSAEAGVQLLGGRRCLYADGTVPHVMYRAAGAAPVSLFRLDGTRAEGEVVTMGYQSRIWSHGGHTFVLVAPAAASAEAMTQLTRYVRQEAR